MAIRKEILHPENDDSVDIYPKTSPDQAGIVPNPSESGSVNLTKIKIGDTVYLVPEGTIVEGNPSQSGSVNLTKIKIGNTVYLVPEGTDVEGNPSESGSVNLTKIKIGNTVYNIPSSGGGISMYAHYITCYVTTNNNIFYNDVHICLLTSSSTPINTSSDLVNALNQDGVLIHLFNGESPSIYSIGIYYGIGIILNNNDYIPFTEGNYAYPYDNAIIQL